MPFHRTAHTASWASALHFGTFGVCRLYLWEGGRAWDKGGVHTQTAWTLHRGHFWKKVVPNTVGKCPLPPWLMLDLSIMIKAEGQSSILSKCCITSKYEN